MSPRNRRLAADLEQMRELAEGGVVSFRSEGQPPDVYHVLVAAPGLGRDAGGTISVRGIHRFTAYLHLEYPRRPPVVTWETPIVHPNILPPERNGGVCIGAWSAGESLADLIRRIVDLVTYRAFNVADALDPAVAEWLRALAVEPGVDVETVAAAARAHATPSA
jgi:ubiquitin-protein ligase